MRRDEMWPCPREIAKRNARERQAGFAAHPASDQTLWPASDIPLLTFDGRASVMASLSSLFTSHSPVSRPVSA